MHRSVPLFIAFALGAGCHAAPGVPARGGVKAPVPVLPAATTAPLLPTTTAPRPLAHEGGIVFARALDSITDVGKQRAAAVLGVELGVGLRAERAMRDAELLAKGSGASFRLLAGTEQHESDASPSPVTPPTNGRDEAAGRTDEQQANLRKGQADEQAEANAKAAWKQLSSEQRKQAEATLQNREAQLTGKLSAKPLARSPA